MTKLAVDTDLGDVVGMAEGDWLRRRVGRERETVREALVSAWNEAPYGGPIPADNPYGDGQAGERIALILAQSLAGRSVASL